MITHTTPTETNMSIKISILRINRCVENIEFCPQVKRVRLKGKLKKKETINSAAELYA